MNEILLKHEAVHRYLQQVCKQVRAKEVHQDIQMELLSHLEELIDDKLSVGISLETAIEQALSQIGDPILIGKQFHAAHKPVMEWGLAAIVAILVGIGFLAMYAMKFAVDQSFRDIFLPNQLTYAGIGVVMMVLVYYLDYRKLQNYSWWIYGCALGLMVLCHWFGMWVNGSRSFLAIGRFGVNVYEVVPYLFMIAFAGKIVMDRRRGQERQMNTWITILVYVVLPGYFYLMSPLMDGLIVHCVGISVLHIVMTRQFKLLLGCMASFMLMIALAVFMNQDKMSFILMRLTSWFNPTQDPSGSGYMYLTLSKVIRSAGLWGQGFGVQMKHLPYIYNDMIFPYLIYSLGWCFGLLLVSMVCILIGHTIRMSLQLKDPFGRALIIGLSTVISFKFIYSILMSVGLLPITSVAMPLISYGGNALVMNMTVMGIMLSVYRRKNMLSQFAK
ncbi:FtsW/RodA/SpoVE family cell cycle protein [Paenibacillus guangzhouensis]|uniref:FtsW/RodA/SpoVE family cell cycle protein n=1 Tax=Paenibacillus guangzhouensis TaxID=1473112 RepID=UPI00187BBB6B|nr:FtsW/RodA/SpoVE family cell cycle protein [Paenibacillus guangzhouensis]